jgi:hypothetical protein
MQERDLKMLATRNAVRAVVVHERPGGDGFDLIVDGDTLESARRDARRFASLDTVATLLRDVGIHRFSVQLAARPETVA